MIKRQLQRSPRGQYSVAKRCQRGSPQIICTLPIIKHQGGKRELFPTTFYLTCPYLVKEIQALESEGWIKQLQRRYHGDSSFRQDLLSSHKGYRDYRESLIPPEEKKELGARLKKMGVGGIRGEGIKCLHAHYAHYQVLGANPVGEIVEALLLKKGDLLCREPCTEL